MEDVRPTVVRTPEGRGCEMDPSIYFMLIFAYKGFMKYIK